ncbi:hypothetical protein L208DRAFT_1412861, partial [Tricholoma matsutake]
MGTKNIHYNYNTIQRTHSPQHLNLHTLRRVSKHPQQNMPQHLRPGPVHPHLRSV